MGHQTTKFKVCLALSCLTFFWTLFNYSRPGASIYALMFLVCAGLTIYLYTPRRQLLRPSKVLIALYLLLAISFISGLRDLSPLSAAVQNMVLNGAIAIVLWKLGVMIYKRLSSTS
jgi:hypothetical protein